MVCLVLSCVNPEIFLVRNNDFSPTPPLFQAQNLTLKKLQTIFLSFRHVCCFKQLNQFWKFCNKNKTVTLSTVATYSEKIGVITFINIVNRLNTKYNEI